VVGGLVVVAVIALTATLTSRPAPQVNTVAPAAIPQNDISGEEDGAPTDAVILAKPVSDIELASLPEATTFDTVLNAPKDPAPGAIPGGRVIHPTSLMAIFAAPGGEPIAKVSSEQLGSETWLPVLSEQAGWALVALPVRPNGSTGWLYLDSPAVTIKQTAYRIEVDRTVYTLALFKENIEIGRWKVGVGKPHSVTPAGRTFVLASIRDTYPTFSPIVLPLGTHSETYTTYGGGPGTAAIHTWPTRDVYGKASSDGCVRIPPEALPLLTTVPLGTTVLIK
jgi:lipoprotein-anchoring transpeptidase ErfK/SrfK